MLFPLQSMKGEKCRELILAAKAMLHGFLLHRKLTEFKKIWRKKMNRVLIDCFGHQIRIAIVKQGELVEVILENKEQKSIAGNIYAGKVVSVVEGMQCAFIDIGQRKNAYYYYGNQRAKNNSAHEKSKKPKTGDTILVQAERDALGEKGAVVGDSIALAGKFLVLLLTEAREISISKKIEDKEERKRIKCCMEQLLPKEYGVIVRTQGEQKTQKELEEEMKTLIKQAEKIKNTKDFLKPPALLYEYGDSVVKLLRDFDLSDIDEMVINDKAMFEMLQKQNVFTHMVYTEQKASFFSAYFVEKQLQKALQKRVWLKSGGFIVIEQTEACVVIDVNTGKYTGKKNLEKTILKTNLEAAEEIAKQLRLRNLSGIIIADFIDMPKKEQQQQLIHALKEFVKKDRIKTTVVGMTELGLVQMTRKKIRPSLQQMMSTKCRCCDGTGRVPSLDWTVMQMRREVTAIFENTIYQSVSITAEKRLLQAFYGENNAFHKELETMFSKKIVCVPKKDMAFSAFIIEKGV